MKRKKIYQIDDTLSIRLTPKAGATDEVIEFINSIEAGEAGQTLIKALKFWIRTQDSSSHERIRDAVEDESRIMNMHYGRYGQNRGPYRKNGGESNEVKVEKDRVRENQKNSNSSFSPSPSAHIVDERNRETENQAPSPNTYFDAEDELYGDGIQSQSTSNGNPMLKALNTIPKRG